MSLKGATIELEKNFNRDDNLLFAEGGSRIIFTIDKTKEKEWLKHLNKFQNIFQSSLFVKKIGYVSGESLRIKIQDRNICNIRVEQLAEKFNNSILDYL